ncbi:SRPBCC family protein [Paenibacillus glycanilyticus]|uniref:SRPBCC family protein n=1 Tax=Paenibacillus glycanilyticus TaxID=126569 RepID=UPI00203D91E2|nr:SRPBCC family protein [Paenibacillus glycanilyticus]MCM3631111.1 SRPBCC family protein [Paenibacillus glycanilyticus]
MELSYVFYINATPQQVWQTLVSPEGTRSTFFGTVLNSALEPGASFEYVGPGADGENTVHVYGTILEADPGKVLSYREHPGPSYRANHAELESRVTFTLETVGTCTKLTLVNDQWTENHPSLANSKEHWWMMLSNIKTYTETGQTLDFGW